MSESGQERPANQADITHNAEPEGSRLLNRFKMETEKMPIEQALEQNEREILDCMAKLCATYTKVVSSFPEADRESFKQSLSGLDRDEYPLYHELAKHLA